MKSGDKIPSERQLCDIYGVSRTTVRNAISELELNGYLKRVQGKGTFVQNPSEKRHNLSDYYSFTEQTKNLGKIPKSEILEYHIEQANSMVQEKMNLDEDEFIIRFIRLRKADNEAMMLETTYIKYEDFPEITKKALEEKALYEIFEENFNRKIVKVEESFGVTSLNKTQAMILDLMTQEPCLKIQRLSYDKDDQVIELTISYARGDKFKYQTTYYPE